jgi:hypothetical protein
VLFISVNTPPKDNGEADLSFVENVSREIARNLKKYVLIVEKSTVPVQTGEWIYKTIKEHLADCVQIIERVKDNQILQGLGELLDEKEKSWVKNHLREEAIFLLKNYMSVLKN